MIRTYTAFFLLGLFWGSNYIYMKWAAPLISPAQISLLRVFFGFVPLAILARRRDVLRLDQVRYLHHFLVMAALATAFCYFSMAKGTALLPSGIAGVLGGSPAIFTSIASTLFLRNEKMNRSMVCGVALGMAGITLIARPWSALSSDDAISLAGVAWMIAGAIVFGLSYIYVRRFLSPINLAPLVIVTWQMGLALLILFVLTDLHGTGQILQDWRATAGVVIGLGFLGTGASFLLYYFLLQDLGAVVASGAVYITPVIALLIGWAAGEQIGQLEIAAMFLILGSLAILEIGRQRTVQSQAVPVPSAVTLD
ncbi:drug/metabolite transporter (DMT)-like permease [Paraburkholderia atlantica]|uniref:Drug/metabolite transporter (DMT)-like permease n=1 Tax=Paraburkholderia atlantica TaxID=2654982 RepID=A0A7W8Q5R4_PARAM|nr:DMT family transporter [Paraburkholderia atlantica]MBB5415011.1 drug/metabolite transporter (DMT)-like permease [Paraburkholderia atlantica]MBB5423809.1 drug/metabolite transporter (DMT)-like permease [Paraburkholderia atlantica]